MYLISCPRDKYNAIIPPVDVPTIKSNLSLSV